MWHAGGVRVVIDGFVGSWAGFEHAVPSTNASHMPRHTF
jgi:hypothetical protein